MFRLNHLKVCSSVALSTYVIQPSPQSIPRLLFIFKSETIPFKHYLPIPSSLHPLETTTSLPVFTKYLM